MARNKERSRVLWRNWIEKNREHRNAYQRRKRAENRERYAVYERRAKLKYNFGITPEDYSNMYEAQSGMCAVCGSRSKTLDVDHSHETGMVRGLLCRKCNLAVGLIGDNLCTAYNIALYLEDAAHQEKP